MECYAGMATLTVQGAMQTPGGGVGGVRPTHRFWIVGIHQNQVGGLDAREMRLIGVHQKLRAALVDGHREVIRHALVKVEPCGPAKGSSEIYSSDPERVGQIGFDSASYQLSRGAHAMCLRFTLMMNNNIPIGATLIALPAQPLLTAVWTCCVTMLWIRYLRFQWIGGVRKAQEMEIREWILSLSVLHWWSSA